MLVKEKITFYIPTQKPSQNTPYFDYGIKAGFPSPAEDFKKEVLSLDTRLIKNKETTFFAHVNGNSMIGAGLNDGDLLIIDKSLEPENGKIAVCFIDGEFTVKRLKLENGTVILMPENKLYKPIIIDNNNELVIWGIVTYVIKKL